ncbi:MAG TPA: hypothetical protein VHB21_02235 [Minicystis sp.]|nr:hypothetical protein [Minicystis sp.]
MSWIGWAIVVVVFVWLLSKRRKRHAAAATSPSPVDAFVAEVVARAVASRSTLGADEITRALAGDPDPEVVARMEELVRDVELGFERMPDGHDVEVRAHVRFEDGTSHDAARRFAEAELPVAARDELQRTGAARAYRRWDLPWSAR